MRPNSLKSNGIAGESLASFRTPRGTARDADHTVPMLTAILVTVALSSVPAPASATLARSPTGSDREPPVATEAQVLISPVTDVFVGGEGGYPVYRIPSIVRIEHGGAKPRLLAFAEARGSYADVGENDLVLRLSDDDGATWSTQRVIAEMAGRSLNNPCAVEVREGVRAGRVVLMFQSYPKDRGEATVVEGYGTSCDAPDDLICRTFVIHSDDRGTTWSALREVTRGVKRATRATSTATGPGVGIQLMRGAHRGRILMPFNEGPLDRWKVYAAISDDGGETWRFGETAPDGAKGVANEVQMFERADGAVVLNARQHLGAKCRKSAVSTDGGATWSKLVDEPNLTEPTCMGGVAVVGGTTVFYTGPDSETRRALGTLWISRDGGRTWPAVGSPDRILIEPEGFAYSVPVVLAPTVVGILFESAGYGRVVFRRVELPARAAAGATQ
jgi:sialidase-1